MKGRSPNAEEKRFIERICNLGCIVCREHLDVEEVPCCPHHMEGKVKPGAHFKILPLCGRHHQTADTEKPPRWYTRHHNKSEFEAAYGAELELYHRCLELLEEETA